MSAPLWPQRLATARQIRDELGPMTLRQLFYRLVAGGVIPNTASDAYQVVIAQEREERETL